MQATTIPKKIWFLWLQGEAAMKPMVQECYRSWQELNPDWEVIVLTRENLTEYIPVGQYLDNDHITMQALSDIVRIMLLRDHGGVWTDASGFCTRPLDDWVHEAVADGFFGIQALREDRLVDSWLLASLPGSYIATTWAAEVERYFALGSVASRRVQLLFQRIFFRFWINCKVYSVVTKPLYLYKRWLGVYSYFWFMYLFVELVARDETFAATWRSMPALAATHGVAAINAGLMQPMTDAIAAQITTNPYGVQKLDVRLPLDEAADDSIIKQLIMQNKQTYSYA